MINGLRHRGVVALRTPNSTGGHRDGERKGSVAIREMMIYDNTSQNLMVHDYI